MFTKPARILSGIALALCLAPAMAQEAVTDEAEPLRRYAVEFIVFRYAEDVGVGTEIFPPEEPEPVPGDMTDFEGGAVPVFSDSAMQPDAGTSPSKPDPQTDQDTLSRIDAVLLLEDELSLQRIRDRLSLLDVYEPILHTGWTQVAPAKDASQPLELAFFGPAPDGLAGTLTLYLGRYLHLVVDLALEDEDTNVSTDFGYDEPEFRFGDNRLGSNDDPFAKRGPVIYRINEDRIMRNEDVRYFDHPRFGVIAKTTRIEEPEPAEASPLPLLPGAGQ